MRGWLHAYAFFVAARLRHRALLDRRHPAGLGAVGELPRSTASPCAGCSASARSTTAGSGRERGYQIMRRLDHSMIFIFIAGTYTPFCVLLLPTAQGDAAPEPRLGRRDRRGGAED